MPTTPNNQVYHKEIAEALRTMQDSFVQFSRNGVWGTCVDCPRDHFNHAFPEFCRNTDRYDHRLDVDGLAQQWKAHEKCNFRRNRR